MHRGQFVRLMYFGMLTLADDEAKDRIQADTGIRPEFAPEPLRDPDGDLRQSTARVHTSPLLPHGDAMRGFVYEVETGRLREVLAA